MLGNLLFVRSPHLTNNTVHADVCRSQRFTSTNSHRDKTESCASGLFQQTLKLCPLLLAGLILAGSCTSRYRLNLYLEIDSTRKKTKVEQSEFYTDVKLGDPFSDKRITNGDNSVVVITTGSRGQTIKTSTGTLVDYDEHLRCKVYLQTDREPAAGRMILADNSFVHLLGRFDQSPQSKTFLPTSGFFVIDSISGGHLFGDIDGSYRNNEGQLLSFDGKFKVSIR